jgi:hypothetical protein
MGLSLLASHLLCLATTPIRSTNPGCGSLIDRHYGTVRMSYLHSQANLARSGTTSHKDTEVAGVYLVLEALASL